MWLMEQLYLLYTCCCTKCHINHPLPSPSLHYSDSCPPDQIMLLTKLPHSHLVFHSDYPIPPELHALQCQERFKTSQGFICRGKKQGLVVYPLWFGKGGLQESRATPGCDGTMVQEGTGQTLLVKTQGWDDTAWGKHSLDSSIKRPKSPLLPFQNEQWPHSTFQAHCASQTPKSSSDFTKSCWTRTAKEKNGAKMGRSKKTFKCLNM